MLKVESHWQLELEGLFAGALQESLWRGQQLQSESMDCHWNHWQPIMIMITRCISWKVCAVTVELSKPQCQTMEGAVSQVNWDMFDPRAMFEQLGKADV